MDGIAKTVYHLASNSDLNSDITYVVDKSK